MKSTVVHNLGGLVDRRCTEPSRVGGTIQLGFTLVLYRDLHTPFRQDITESFLSRYFRAIYNSERISISLKMRSLCINYAHKSLPVIYTYTMLSIVLSLWSRSDHEPQPQLQP